ncbi:uncharacterized protein MELLADRAFT_106000 [Melampsora larici-populina 98AG31]|uniref:Secreted protein n=1 Tax=Melampsora larici-populina (strain 98AG31 / pathotype 3-4-7) TaxID=747676 RepID=F4RK20_MELLP|nr:uncharacterized protein MELLADRAFT_106000 [Melampsora larici-populina 98AG31]EGG07264.1 secreted protein [Melampsora larici-populina 98AG31]
MNHVRACLYLWALFAAGTAWARFDMNSDGCPGTRLTACEERNKICGASVKCPRCHKPGECGVTASSAFDCRDCGGIHYLNNRHTHDIACCSSCSEQLRDSVSFKL